MPDLKIVPLIQTSWMFPAPKLKDSVVSLSYKFEW